MADNRIKDLSGEVIGSEIQALLGTLFIAVDDTSFSEAKKVLLKTILTESIVSANTNNYQAMSPKAFYDSVMTTTRRGIQRLATDTEVTNKESVGVLNSVDQILMQAQWKKDWFESNGVPKLYTADDIEVPSSMSFTVDFNNSMSAAQAIAVSPVLPAGYRYHSVAFSFAADVTSIQGAGFNTIFYSGSTEYVTLVIVGGTTVLLRLRLSADGRELAIYAPITTSAAFVSMSINATIRSI